MIPRPAHAQPTRPGADDADESVPISPEVEQILRERLARDEPSDPWPVVKRRILERRPVP